MHKQLNLDKSKKLNILCRIEPGCLGPDGMAHIENFCRFANQALKQFKHNYLIWIPLPRYDKSLPEMQYSINDRQLDRDKVSQYLAHFGYELDSFEEMFHEHLSELIDQFLAKK